MQQQDPRHLLKEVAKILQGLNIPYIITGGMAVLVWGRPRFTADIDIVIELKPEHIHPLTKALLALGKDSYIDEQMVKDALERGGEFNFIHSDTGVKVDFWALEKQPFDLSRMERRIPKDVLGETIYFISPEDLVLSKLQWYQQAGSDRHLEDVESVLRISSEKIDMNYLKHWAKKLGVLEILSKLIIRG